jgi:hypothetical protein
MFPRSKERTILDRANSGIVSSNPTMSMDYVCVCVVLYCVRRSPCQGPIRRPGIPTKRITVSRVNREFKQARGSNS